MPLEHLEKFAQLPKTDADLRNKLEEATNAETVVEIAKAAGFVISAEDAKEFEKDGISYMCDVIAEGYPDEGDPSDRVIYGGTRWRTVPPPMPKWFQLLVGRETW